MSKDMTYCQLNRILHEYQRNVTVRNDLLLQSNLKVVSLSVPTAVQSVGQLDPQMYGGGFLLACDDSGRMFDNSFPACAFFFFFWKWRLARVH